MEARRGRVEADVAGHDLLSRQRVEGSGVGQLMNVAALVEQLQQGGIVRIHDCRLASLTCSCYTLAVQLNLAPHPAMPPTEPFKLWVNVEHSAAFGVTATTNIWFGIGAPAHRFLIAEPV